MRDFRTLTVWQKSHRLALAIHRAAESIPSRDSKGMTNQMTRAAASIPANLAEGCGTSGSADVARFADIALGSAKELENHLLLARDLGLLDDASHAALEEQTMEVSRMLYAFSRGVHQRASNGRK